MRSAFVGGLASLERESGQLNDALRLYTEAVNEPLAARQRQLMSVLSAELAGLYAEMDRTEDADETLRRADPASVVTALHRAQLYLANARATHVDPDERAAALARARQALSEGRRTDLTDDRARFALRMLERAHRQVASRAPREPTRGDAEAILRLRDEGRTLQLPGGAEIDLGTRGASRLIMVALARCHLEQPGQATPASRLIEAGWPGERMRPQAAASRLYMTISRLRRLGLRDVLVRRDDGYLIDPKLRVIVED